MKIMIIGAGAIGSFLAKNLCNDNDVVVIEKDRNTCERIKETLDVLAVQGEGDKPGLLQEMGIEKTDIFLAVSGDDKVNLLSSLLAHAKGVETIIARLSDPDYLEYPPLLKMLDISTLNPSAIFAESITNLISAPFATIAETFAGGKIQMLKLRINEDTPIVGRKLSELGPPIAWIFVALSRKGEIAIPSGDTVLEPGDYVYALGAPTDFGRLKVMLGLGEEGVRSVVLVGAGELGKMVARNLLEIGVSVKLLDPDSERARVAAEELNGVDVFEGDANSVETLKEIGVSGADYFIALTGDDENNVLSALLAKGLGAGKTVVLYAKADYIEVIESIGVDRAISVRLATANEILSYLHLGGVAHVALVEEGKAEVLEFIITKKNKILGIPLKDCSFPGGALVGIVLSGKNVVIPNGDYVPMVGDRFIVFALPEAEKDVEKLFGQ